MNKSKGFTTIYVNVGWPTSDIPTLNKVLISVNLDEQTEIQAAKLVRKAVADSPADYGWSKGTDFKPSQLYYEVYRDMESNIPTAMSFNAPYRRNHVNSIIL